MKRIASALVLVAVAAAANAATIFDSLYADAGQTAPRALNFDLSDPNYSFDTFFFLQQHFVSSEFIPSTSTSMSYVQFGYQNRTNALVTGPITGSIEIFDTVNPHVGEINYSGIAYPDATGNAQETPMFTTSFSVDVSAAANGSGIAGFSLPSSVSLTGGHIYGFAIRTDSASIVPSVTIGGTVGAGSLYHNILHYDFGDTGTIPASGIYNSTVGGTSVGYALYTVAPQATPEPSAFAALGLGAVAVLRRRKRA